MLTEKDKEFLERLNQTAEKEENAAGIKSGKLLHIRNILNAIFILLAIIAMVGILISKTRTYLVWSYGVGILAVVIKMAEVVLRYPSMIRNSSDVKNRRRSHKNIKNLDMRRNIAAAKYGRSVAGADERRNNALLPRLLAWRCP